MLGQEALLSFIYILQDVKAQLITMNTVKLAAGQTWPRTFVKAVVSVIIMHN